jgi:phosphoserine aminotransferase
VKRAHNFGAGPSALPLPVLEQARAELLDYRGRGMSVLEISHRGEDYRALNAAAQTRLRALLGLDDSFRVLFLGGGATLQFAMLPLNLLPEDGHAAYLLSGAWGRKAFADAQRLGDARALWDDDSRLPGPREFTPDPDAAYLHLTSNETIGGLQWPEYPSTGGAPLVMDASSDFLSRPLPVSRLGLAYAGAQKNAGPAGVTVVIVRESLLGRSGRALPSYLDYGVHAAQDSMANTPPVFAVYLLGLVLDWLEAEGGLMAAASRASERAALIYGAIDASGGFYRCPVPTTQRSSMNVVFRLQDESLEKRFLAAAGEAGLVGLKGHRSVGGCRASLYNGLPLASARVLAEFMREFARTSG